MAFVVCGCLLVACASNIDHPIPGGPSFERDDFRFVAPTGWEVRSSTGVAYGPSSNVVYLANQPLHDDCVMSTTEASCQSPIDGELRAGGMLVTWVEHHCVAQGCDLPPEPLITIGNRQGVHGPIDVGCEGTGFTERSAYYVTVTPQRVDILFTCARDPSDATRSAFLGFLDGIHWRIP
jgi:hypothetical protein